MLNRGDLIELKIDKFIFEGYGLGTLDTGSRPELKQYEQIKVLVPYSYPGDVITASVRKIKKKYLEARVAQILEPSPFRVQERCSYFRTCGGCKQQDLAYEQQLRHKEQQVEELFSHTGGISGYTAEPIIPSDGTFFYRNKMEYSFSPAAWLTEEFIQSGERIERPPALGLHVPQGFNKVLSIDECFLQSETSNEILRFTKEFFFKRNTPVYDTNIHDGYLRNLVIKQSANTAEIMVNLVTFSRDEKLMSEYCAGLLANVPQITTVVNSINTKKAMVATGETEFIDYGRGCIYDKLGAFSFKISANAFFQTNTRQAEKLYALAAEFAEFTGNEIVYDLYCGSGTIAIFISPMVKRCYGFEVVEQAVTDARVNSELNDARNVEFFTADLYKSMLGVVQENDLPLPGVMIVDPPRSGMHKNTIQDIIALSPKKLVYVSCNPATQVRDIIDLRASGYELIKIRPVDMFPHTFHIENVALLVRQ